MRRRTRRSSGQSCASRARWAASADSIAARGSTKTAKNSSPRASTSWPPPSTTAVRTSRRVSERIRAQWSDASRTSRVDPSTSAKRNVTSPLGSPPLTPPAPRSRRGRARRVARAGATGSLLKTRRRWRAATSPPQPVIGVAATPCSSSRADRRGASSPSAAASSSSDQPPAAGITGRPSSWATTVSRRRCHSATHAASPSSGAVSAASAAACAIPPGTIVVDVDEGEVSRQLPGGDDPAEPPADQPLLHRDRADRHRSLAQAGERGRMHDGPAVEDDPLHQRPVEQPEVVLADDLGDGLPFLRLEHAAGRERRIHQEEDARARAGRGTEGVEVEPPRAVAHLQRHEARQRARQPDPVDHARVHGVCDEHLVARIGEREQRVEQSVPLAAGDHDLGPRVVGPPAAALDVRCDRALDVEAAGEREVAVELVEAGRCARRLDRLGRRRQVGVEVLEP